MRVVRESVVLVRIGNLEDVIARMAVRAEGHVARRLDRFQAHACLEHWREPSTNVTRATAYADNARPETPDHRRSVREGSRERAAPGGHEAARIRCRAFSSEHHICGRCVIQCLGEGLLQRGKPRSRSHGRWDESGLPRRGNGRRGRGGGGRAMGANVKVLPAPRARTSGSPVWCGATPGPAGAVGCAGARPCRASRWMTIRTSG